MPGGPFFGAAGGEGSGVEGVDLRGRAGAEGDMGAADRGAATGGQPEVRPRAALGVLPEPVHPSNSIGS